WISPPRTGGWWHVDVLNFAARRDVMNRRDFVQIASGAVALAAFQDNAVEKAQAAAQSVNGRKPDELAHDEDYWAEIRDAFTIDRNVINLNNGHVSPAPRPVQDAMRRYLEVSDMEPWS